MAQSVVSGNLPPPTFDLDAWAANYTGPLLPFRLAHIAIHCPSLAEASLTLAIAAVTNGKNVQLYSRLTTLATTLNLPELASQGPEWATRQDEANRREQARLESELRGYKNNLIRESTRMGQEDFAMHLLLTGGPPADPNNPASQHAAGYSAAYQAFGRMRDYCTTPAHVNSMTLRLAFTALLQAVSAQQQTQSYASTHWSSVLINASRLKSTGVKEEDQALLTPVAYTFIGLAHLGQGNYRDAAESFLSLPFKYHNLGPVHGVDYEQQVASANDVAIYGGVCALATLPREELMSRVLGGPFRPFLEQEPHMRKAITLYTTAKYQACLSLLQHYHSDWSLDILLGPHVDALFARIRERSITAYFSSFSQVSLASLASTFPPAVTSSNPAETMEQEVLSMMKSGLLDARLDAVNGILVALHQDLRQAAHADAREAAAEIERTLRLRLHRVNMIAAGLEIPRAKAATGWS